MRDLPKEARGSNPNPSPSPSPNPSPSPKPKPKPKPKPSTDQVRDLPEEALQSAVRRCNYCVTKADNVRKAAIRVAAAGVPSSYEALVGLPRA